MHIAVRQCTAEGGQNLRPELPDEMVCARFVSAFNHTLDAAGVGPAEVPPLAFTLSFTGTGIARAEVRRAGSDELWFDANIAVSDRTLDVAAVDRLAARVAERLREG